MNRQRLPQLPPEIMQGLAESNRAQAIHAQMTAQQQMIQQQRDYERELYVRRFIEQTARDIYVGVVINREYQPDENNDLRALAQESMNIAKIFGQEIGLLMSDEDIARMRAEMEAAEEKSKEQTDEPPNSRVIVEP